MKKLFVVLMIGGIVLSLGVCSMFGNSEDDGGGEGADFDSSLYYTKTEVEALIAAVTPEWDLTDAQELTDVDWGGRTPTGFTVPDGAQSVLVEVIASSSVATNNFYIQFSQDDGGGTIIAQFKLSADGYSSYLGLAQVPAGATTMYGWNDTGHDTPQTDLANISVSIQPRLWLKQ